MPLIHCYLTTPDSLSQSVFPGQTVRIHVSTDQYSYQYIIKRKKLGNDDVLYTSSSISGSNQSIPSDAYINGCGWSYVEYTIPSNWVSGVYYVEVVTQSNPPNGSYSTKALFVIKALEEDRNNILFQLSTNTYQAYNNFGGKSLYDYNSSDNSRSHIVSFERPTPVDQFEWWELQFLRWLEKKEYNVDFCTSIDIQSDSGLLNSYQLLLSVGHDEYWSKDMRDNVEDFIDNGGNVSFFTGNTSWWQVRYFNEDEDPVDLTKLVCYKDAGLDPVSDEDLKTITWRDAGRPENFMTGISYNYGAFQKDDPIPEAKYKTRFSKHWLFKDTGLNDQEEFGREADPMTLNLYYQVIGYETDGAVFYNDVNKNLPFAKSGENTPLNLIILATCNLTDWGYDDGWSGLDGHSGWACMTVYKRNGVVFNAGTVYWSLGLKPYLLYDTEDDVHHITKNVIDILQESFGEQDFIIRNSGFEDWDGGVPVSWSKEGSGAISESTVDPYNGSSSLFIDASSDAAWVSQQFFPCQANRQYRVSCHVKSDYENPPSGKIKICLQNLNTWQDFAEASYTLDTGNWEYIYEEDSYSSSPTDNYIFPARVKIYVDEGYTAYFDEVKVTEL